MPARGPSSPPGATVNPDPGGAVLDPDLSALLVSLALALTSVVVLFLVGAPLAWWLRGALARRSFWAALVSAVVALPLVLPPTVLGFYVLLALGPQGPIGQVTTALGLGTLAFSFPGLVIASVIYTLPFVVQPLQVAFAAQGSDALEAAAVLGASPFDRFVRLAVPAAAPAFLTAGLLAFAHVLGEFGIVLMIGGSVPGRTRVLSIAIFDHVESLEFGRAHLLAAALVVFSLAALALLQYAGAPLLFVPRDAPRGARGAEEGGRDELPPEPQSVSNSDPRSESKSTAMGPDPAPSRVPGQGTGRGLEARVELDRPSFTLNVGLHLPPATLMCLVGASGSGKTSLLRALAGLEPGARGRILADGETWLDSARSLHLPAHRRRAVMVFQDTRLFRHLDVRGNLDFAPGRSSIPPPYRDEAVQLAGVGGLLDRRVETLSRGESQRVGFARALLAAPRLLLLDEPFSGLDAHARARLLASLQQWVRHHGASAIYVTHDLDEASGLEGPCIELQAGRELWRSGQRTASPT